MSGILFIQEGTMKRILAGLLAIALPTSIFAAEGGLSNYVPAFYGDLALATEPPDGLSLRNDVFYVSGDIGRSFRSGTIRAEVDATLLYNYLTVLYKPEWELFGAPVAFGITPAIGHADIEASVQAGELARAADDDKTGLGDTTLAAMLFGRRGKCHFSLSGYVVTPTGDYDVDDLANIGVNYWTFEVDTAVTYLNEETGQDYSLVLGYGYNTENDDTDYQSGDEIHADFVLNQFLTETLAVGINGYYYRQISGDSGGGALLGSFKGEGAGIGLGGYYGREIAGRDVFFVAKWVHDYHAENRVKADYVYASFMLSI